MELMLEQAKQLLQMFGGEETTVSLTETGEGLCAYYTDYPEEGSIILGTEDAGLALRARQRKALEKTLSRDPKYKK